MPKVSQAYLDKRRGEILDAAIAGRVFWRSEDAEGEAAEEAEYSVVGGGAEESEDIEVGAGEF